MNSSFIVLEGPDGAGTTSHSKKLAEHLQNAGKNVLHTFEATDGPIGTFVRQQLKTGGMPASAMQMLFSADRAWHEKNVILPALEKGQIVICDRYSLSTVVYGTALGVDTPLLEYMNKFFIQPSLQLLLLPPFSVCMERLGIRQKDSFESDDSLQKRVYDLYSAHAQTMPAENVFDTGNDMEETAKAIAKRVDEFLS
jgi:dTMP kinase